MLLNEFLERSAEKFPDKDALVCGDVRMSYGDIENDANRLAAALVDRRLGRGERVAVHLENSAESVVSIFGTLKAGGVFVIVNPQVKARKLEYILNDCQVKVLITDTRHLAALGDLGTNCPALEAVIVTDAAGESVSSGKRPVCVPYAGLLAQFSARRPPKRVIDVDLASLIYTSGSTGNPKGVMLTHFNMVSAANSITEYLDNRESDVILSCLPLSFDYGLYQVLMAAKFGGTVVLERSFTYPYRIIDLLIREKATGFPLVPTMAVILLQLKNIGKFDFPRLRYITNTAQALAPRHIAQLRELFSGTRLYSMYGLTECKRVSYLPPEELDARPSSVGKAMPNTEAYIVDENGERITAAGTAGELVVRGASVMRGYWNLPEETARRLKDGPVPGEKLLYTGDLFKMDDEGFLYFLARKDDIIKTSGERVSPKEIENVLYEMEDIAEAAVVGVDDAVLGQAIKAVVVLKDGSTLTGKDIRLHCAKNLEMFKIPKIIEIRKSLPKTLTGKIQKAVLSAVQL